MIPFSRPSLYVSSSAAYEVEEEKTYKSFQTQTQHTTNKPHLEAFVLSPLQRRPLVVFPEHFTDHDTFSFTLTTFICLSLIQSLLPLTVNMSFGLNSSTPRQPLQRRSPTTQTRLKPKSKFSLNQ